MSNKPVIDLNIDYHYFASSALGWNTGDKINQVINRRRREDRPKKGLQANSFAVWYVPLPNEAHYTINGYAPDVEGAVQIIYERY